ncbi:hypothetical protein Tco_0646456, partial [Tanacetum coccineum]
MSNQNPSMLREHVVSVPNISNVVANAANNGLGTSPKEIQSLLEKFLADMSNLAHNNFGEEQFANEDTGYVPSPDTPIVHLVSISKPVSYAGASGASFVVLKNVKANFRPLESKNLCDGVDLNISKKVVEE